ncbi:MAG: guanylate kinase, partial [Lachnospiraceae bacterium]|nr:guanylate kinase [Lachnospiraceae bacterium]
MTKRGLLIVVSGFAGCGKGTLMKRLIEEYEEYALSVSMTTRLPRPGEVHGREYFFVSREKFEQEIETDGLIEYATYVENYYGTPKAYVDEQISAGKNFV